MSIIIPTVFSSRAMAFSASGSSGQLSLTFSTSSFPRPSKRTRFVPVPLPEPSLTEYSRFAKLKSLSTAPESTTSSVSSFSKSFIKAVRSSVIEPVRLPLYWVSPSKVTVKYLTTSVLGAAAGTITANISTKISAISKTAAADAVIITFVFWGRFFILSIIPLILSPHYLSIHCIF